MHEELAHIDALLAKVIDNRRDFIDVRDLLRECVADHASVLKVETSIAESDRMIVGLYRQRAIIVALMSDARETA